MLNTKTSINENNFLKYVSSHSNSSLLMGIRFFKKNFKDLNGYTIAKFAGILHTLLNTTSKEIISGILDCITIIFQIEHQNNIKIDRLLPIFIEKVVHLNDTTIH